jgi:hypothetical protein
MTSEDDIKGLVSLKFLRLCCRLYRRRLIVSESQRYCIAWYLPENISASAKALYRSIFLDDDIFLWCLYSQLGHKLNSQAVVTCSVVEPEPEPELVKKSEPEP